MEEKKYGVLPIGFSKNDVDKEYNVKKYFYERIRFDQYIKSVGIVTANDYRFSIFDHSNNDDHRTIIIDNMNELGIEEHTKVDKFLFSCDYDRDYVHINFYGIEPGHKNTDPFIGECIIKILEEFKEFVDEYGDNILFDDRTLGLSNNFFRNNEIESKIGFITEYLNKHPEERKTKIRNKKTLSDLIEYAIESMEKETKKAQEEYKLKQKELEEQAYIESLSKAGKFFYTTKQKVKTKIKTLINPYNIEE